VANETQAAKPEETVLKRRNVLCRLGLGFCLIGALSATPALAWEKGKLLIWVNNDKGYKGLQKVGDEFTRKTGIKVKVETPDNATDAFAAAMAKGNGPDIWIWPHDRIGDWVKSGYITPIDASPALKTSIVQVAWDGFTSQGKIWGYPIAVEAISLIYNKDLVPTPPRSYEEFVAIQEKLKPQGIRAVGWETQSPYFTWPMLAANGGYPFERDLLGNYQPKNTGINHPGAIKGAEILVKLIKAGVVVPNLSYADAETAMKEKKQAMWINGPWAWDSLTKAGIRFGIAPLPTVADQPARPFVGVLGAMLTKGSPNRDSARDFIENYLLQPEGIKTVNADKPIGVPASKNIFWDFYSDTQIRQAMEGIFAGKPMPNNPEMQFFWKNLSKALQETTTGSKKPKDALDEAARNIVAGQ
jgi:maltose/maltodextrin transport system substrate-binding protein